MTGAQRATARAIVDREIARLGAEEGAEEPAQEPAEPTEWPESGPRRSPLTAEATSDLLKWSECERARQPRWWILRQARVKLEPPWKGHSHLKAGPEKPARTKCPSAGVANAVALVWTSRSPKGCPLPPKT